MNSVMRKPDFCKCENKGADQLHGNRAADQHLCFALHRLDSTIPVLFLSKDTESINFDHHLRCGGWLPKFEILSL